METKGEEIEMMRDPMDDQQARERVRGRDLVAEAVAGGPFDRDTCLVVRAGAGSGKTRALVERMVALVRTGVALRNMAAITFTVRAAGEMRSRFFLTLRETVRDLDEALARAPDPRLQLERDRAREASTRTDDLFVDTIHSFCRTMLAERPFEAGIPPDFRQVDDREEAEIRSRFWHGYLDGELRHGARPPEWWAEIGIDPGDLASFFGTRCKHEDLPLAPGRAERPDLRPAVDETLDWLDRVLPGIPDAGANRDDLTDVLHRMNRYRRLIEMDSPGSRAAFLQMLDALVKDDGELKDGKARVGLWKDWGGGTYELLQSLRGRSDQPVVEPLGAFVLRAVRPAVIAWKEYVYAEVREFVDGAVDAYRKHRCGEGLLTFQDLLLRAADLLRSNDDARRHFRQRYAYLLVDEFQDTDPVQAEIVFLLTASEDDISDWTRAHPAPGSLFLVGDDKQSIYRFRRADVQVFRQACDLIETGGGETVRFVTNFRSESRICDWVNRAVRPAFGDPEPYQAPWEDLHPYLGAGTTPDPVLALDLEQEIRNNGRLVARQEAGFVTAMIRRLLAGLEVPTSSGAPAQLDFGPVDAGDIMILVRKATHAAEYTRALDAAAIPYVTSGGKSLGKEPVVAALLDLLEAALDPDDPVALVAVLRGSLVGASDEDLRQFRAAGGTFAFDAPAQPPSASDAFTAVRDGIRLVESVRRLFDTYSVGEAMARLLDGEALLAGMAVRRNGSSAAGALVRLLGISRDIDGAGGGWIEMMDELRRLSAGEIEAEAQTLEAGGSAVRVMTVHQAKGLQARVVFLAFPLGGREHPVGFHVDRSGGEPTLYLPCRKDQAEIARPVGWDAAEREALRFEAAEENRLVYVAATRARDLLVVSRYRSKIAGPWMPLYDALESVPAVDTAALMVLPVEAESHALHHNDMMHSLESTQEVLERAARPTYLLESVTGGASDQGAPTDPFSVETEGLGRGFGRAVHRLFQAVIEHRKDPRDRAVLEALADRLVREETGARSASLAERAVRAADAFRAGPVWAEVVASDRVLCEFPIVRFLDDGEVPRLVSGVIDLLYRVEAGWVIVDFKTEALGPRALADRYAAQLDAYRTHWMELSGEAVERTVIWPAVPDAKLPVVLEA
jgi:ATP-dependent helicase/nuclease subunit A